MIAELPLEADGADVLISVFRAGPCPEVAVHERRVELVELSRALCAAVVAAPVRNAPPPIVASLKQVRTALDVPWPSYGRRPLERERVPVTPRPIVCCQARCPAGAGPGFHEHPGRQCLST